MNEYPLANKIKAKLTRVLLSGKTKNTSKQSNNVTIPMPKAQVNAPVAGINAPIQKKEKDFLKKALLKAFGFNTGASYSVSQSFSTPKPQSQGKPRRSGGAVKVRGSTRTPSSAMPKPASPQTTSISYRQSVVG